MSEAITATWLPPPESLRDGTTRSRPQKQQDATANGKPASERPAEPQPEPEPAAADSEPPDWEEPPETDGEWPTPVPFQAELPPVGADGDAVDFLAVGGRPDPSSPSKWKRPCSASVWPER